MSADAFLTCMAFTLAQEGGYSNNPNDPGGPTKYGVTLAELSHWHGFECSAQDVKELQQTDVLPIYLAEYFDPGRCGDLPPGLDLMVFDFGVNAGMGTSVRFLQMVLGVDVDGRNGPGTAAAAAQSRAKVREFISVLAGVQIAHYRGLHNWRRFGVGWAARTERRRTAALARAIYTPE